MKRIKTVIRKAFNKIENHNKFIKRIVQFLNLLLCKPVRYSDNSIIASLTSYPPRINSCWITITSLFNQNFKGYKILLVLSLEEFPSKQIPWTLKLLRFKGLEILWCKENYKSYKKLIPVKKKYPNSTIITFDDDTYYEKWRIKKLISEHKIHPKALIGHRGRQIKVNDNNEVDIYVNWKLSSKRFDTKYTFLIGVGGILYPPNKHFDCLIQDYSLAIKLSPNADDIFFWAVAYHLNIHIICLGNRKTKKVLELRKSPKLWALNKNSAINNDTQMKKVMEYFKINL